MEDSSSLLRLEDSRGHTSLALVGVYDGHDGEAASTYLQQHLSNSVAAQLGLAERSGFALPHVATASSSSSSSSSAAEYGFNDDAAQRALVGGFAACEKALVSSQCAAGATAAVVMLQTGGRNLNVAWCGDCRVVLCRSGTAVALTKNHTPKNLGEKARVLREGGAVRRGRLAGTLAVTRAFGDLEQQPPTAAFGSPTPTAHYTSAAQQRSPSKSPGLTAQPELVSEPLRSEDEFLLLATEGLWDVLSSEEAVRIARADLVAYEDAQMAAEKLVEVALSRRTEDNVTVAVVQLFGSRRGPQAVAQHHHGFRAADRSHSFVHLNTPSNFVRVVGGFQ